MKEVKKVENVSQMVALRKGQSQGIGGLGAWLTFGEHEKQTFVVASNRHNETSKVEFIRRNRKGSPGVYKENGSRDTR